MRRTRARVRTAAEVCAGVALGAGLAAVTGGALAATGSGHHEPAVTVIEGASAFHFDDLAEMVATSTTVLRGTVVDVARGTVFEDSEVTYTRKLLTIEVEQALAGQPESGEVQVETAGWQQVAGEAETELRFADDLQVLKGDRGVFFLYDFEHNGRFGFVSEQGVLLLEGTRLQDSARADALVAGLETLTTAQLEARVAEAGEAILQGRVAPHAFPGAER